MSILVFNHHKYTESLLKCKIINDEFNEHSQHTIVRWVRALQAGVFNLLFCTKLHYCLTLASFPGAEGSGERAPGTHCLRMRLIATEFRGDRVRTYTYVYW